MYDTSGSMLYREKAFRHEPAEAAGIAEYIQLLCVQIGNTVFTGLNRKPHGATQAGHVAQHLPWLIQTYDRMGGRFPEKA